MERNNNNSGLILAAIIAGVFLIVGILLTHALSGTSNQVTTNNYTPPSDSGNIPPGGGPSSSGGNQIQYTDKGVRSYWHEDGSYPQPPDNGAIVAHGDIQNDGNCHIRIFYTGDTVANLGHGTFRLVQLTGGDRNAILQYVQDNIQPPLQRAYGSCPII